MNDIISVIVPVYNVEKYVAACIKSILSQTYQNFEVLLVDDGSSDTSGNICDEFAKIDSRIRVFHKHNGGPSSARNYGLRYARGGNITFVDSDDSILPNFLEQLYNILNESHAFMACSNNPSYDASLNSKKYFIVSAREACLASFGGSRLLYASITAWPKLLRADVAKSFLFPEGRTHEDVATVPKWYFGKNNGNGFVAFSPCCLYQYTTGNETSIMHTPSLKNKMDLLYAKKNICAFFDELDDEEICSCAWRNFRDKLIDYSLEERKIRKSWKDYYSFFQKTCVFSRLKLKLFCAYHFPALYNILKTAKDKLKRR